MILILQAMAQLPLNLNNEQRIRDTLDYKKTLPLKERREFNVCNLPIGNAVDGFKYNEIDGTKNSDILLGTSAADDIKGKDGGDVIQARDDDDIIHGGKGDDSLQAGFGNDNIHADSGYVLMRNINNKKIQVIEYKKGWLKLHFFSSFC
jgi:Ca2+-binding RTX toxin-like protein